MKLDTLDKADTSNKSNTSNTSNILDVVNKSANRDGEKIYGFYIYGITQTGETFRPSDWVDRLCGIMASFVPVGVAANSMCYSPYVEPFVLKYQENSENKEARVVRVDCKIAEIESKALIFLKDFAKNNQLKTEMIYEPIIHEGL